MPTRCRLSLLAVLCALLVPATAPAAISKSTRMKLHDKAVAAAKALKEPKPTSLRAVRTTYGKVKKAFATGPARPASTPVFVITMKGRFVDSRKRVYHRYNLVLSAKGLRGIVAYLGVPYPTQLGSTTPI